MKISLLDLKNFKRKKKVFFNFFIIFLFRNDYFFGCWIKKWSEKKIKYI